MLINIFDVEHGFCALLRGSSGETVLVDSGHNSETNFYPAAYLISQGITHVNRLVISNYDEDHISGLETLLQNVNYSFPVRNFSVSPEVLRQMKRAQGPLSQAMSYFIRMISQSEPAVTMPSLTSMEMAVFSNPYPNFTDTNNLSLVTFVQAGGINIVFPGDLEAAGWRALLQSQAFCEHLTRSNFFVASHHGRESGYCPEVFRCCSPEIVIISDESIQFDTQRSVNYGQHAGGVQFPSGVKYTVTTRSHGMIVIKTTIDGGRRIEVSRNA